MQSKLRFASVLVLACLAVYPLMHAQQTSRVIPFNGVATTIAPGTLGQTLTIQLWDVAAGGNVFYCENQTLDVDPNGNISFNFGAGTTPTPACASTPPGLNPPDFPTGSSRFLDVVDGTGTSVLPSPPGRIPLTAVAFALSSPNDVPGNLTLVNSTATAGNIFKGGTLFLSNFGTQNTFLGQNAGNLTMSGFGNNTAVGFNALNHNTTGSNNTAVGASALFNNTVASDNTAVGASALASNTTGVTNTGVGSAALTRNTTGSYNTALGWAALRGNLNAYNNTAIGFAALESNTSGTSNTALGEGALQFNTSGGNNTAIGTEALFNSRGSYNTAVGAAALTNHQAGFYNVAVGQNALGQLTQGTGNIAIGLGAGANHVTGNNNIDIGYGGFNGDSYVIHLGDQTVHGATFIGGIYGNPIGGTRQVFINSAGQVTTTSASSRRYKEQITDQGAESDVLMKLRPVAFYYKPQLDADHIRQYGLIAEEVSEVAPNLVVFDKEGEPSGVRYDMVNAMLLNEVQKQRRMIDTQQHENDALREQLDRMKAALELQQISRETELVQLRKEISALRRGLEQHTSSLVEAKPTDH